MAEALTSEDIRKELGEFASSTLRHTLEELRERLRKDVRDELRLVLNSSPEVNLLQYTPSPEADVLPALPHGTEKSASGESLDSKKTKGGGKKIMVRSKTIGSKNVKESVKWLRMRTMKSLNSNVKQVSPAGVGDESPSDHPLVGDDMETNSPHEDPKDVLAQHFRLGNVELPQKATSVLRNSDAYMNKTSTKPTRQNSGWSVNPASPRAKAIKFVESSRFEHAVMIVILINALYIGVATQVMAQSDSTDNIILELIEGFFLCVFAIELAVKYYAFRGQTFARVFTDGPKAGYRNIHFRWNVFDWLVVGVQATELVLTVATNDEEGIFVNFTILRLLRLLRVTRVLRVVKIFTWVKDLRTILDTISNAMSLFLWSAFSLVLITFVWAIFFTEAVTIYKCKGNNGCAIDTKTKEELVYYFGSPSKSTLSLLQAITGGIDWIEISTVLNTMGKGDLPVELILFVAYVMFAVLAMMNVISGVFLEHATERARAEREDYLEYNARHVFAKADHNGNGTISWPDFEGALRDPVMETFFDAIDLDISDAKTLFQLLDNSDDGFIEADEFMCGCMRLRGTAKALDLVVLDRELRDHIERNEQIIRDCKKEVEDVNRTVTRILLNTTRMVSQLAAPGQRR